MDIVMKALHKVNSLCKGREELTENPRPGLQGLCRICARRQNGAEIQAGLCLLVQLHPLEKEVSF